MHTLMSVDSLPVRIWLAAVATPIIVALVVVAVRRRSAPPQRAA
ncbi:MULTISPECIES: hypothetical protein [Nocardia]|nr:MULTISPECIES: hypothetical protein [Nocardia]